MSEPKTHYEILGVARAATDKEIRSAYRRLAIEVHPDRSRDPAATEKFIAIQGAYEALIDPTRRAHYDALLASRAAAPRPKPAPPPKQAAKPSPPKKNSPQTRVDQRKAEADMRLRHTQEHMRLTTMMAKGRTADAERLAQRLIEEDPRAPLPYAALGDIARFRGDMKRAAELYGYAAQFAPGNPVYQRKYEEILRTMNPAPEGMGASFVWTPTRNRGGNANAVVAAIAVVVLCALYLMLSRERPIVPTVDLLNTWTLGLFGMLLVAGIAVGSCLSAGGFLDAFGPTHSRGVAHISPPLMLGAVAAINFWLAAAIYYGIAISQDAVNASTSRVIGAVAMVTALFTLVCAAMTSISGGQVLLWGGNLAYIGALCGWMVTDAFRASRY